MSDIAINQVLAQMRAMQALADVPLDVSQWSGICWRMMKDDDADVRAAVRFMVSKVSPRTEP